VSRGEIVLETGFRQQTSGATVTLSSGPLTFIRIGIAKRCEIGIAPPANEFRAVSSNVVAFDNARGSTDPVLAIKYLVSDLQSMQVSIGGSYSPPLGRGEFTAGAPTYSLSLNAGFTLGSRWSFSTSQVFGTGIGTLDNGNNSSYFVYSPSFTFAYALDGATTLLAQSALLSRQGPLLPSGNRSLVALQQAVGDRLALDVEYEVNAKPLFGPQHAIGFGAVWILKV
jgi:hypothetical protein